ncbi:hypothetical protein K1719_012411 [Acacia pycnantha]|nr:hypothetical protein K1719_012411 [Acacia pycnantha]
MAKREERTIIPKYVDELCRELQTALGTAKWQVYYFPQGRMHSCAVHEFPSKLFFFCEVEPASGGETPIVLSHVVYERMKERHPDFVERLEKHGLMYIRVLGEDDNPSSPIGRGWKSTFLTKDKIIAEERFVVPNLNNYCVMFISWHFTAYDRAFSFQP